MVSRKLTIKQHYQSEVFQDIVLGDFQDAYKSLTRKILMGLNWVTKFCSGAQYVLKNDDDPFVHIPRLTELLTKNPADSKGHVYGFLNSNAGVQRKKGKWVVTNDEYSLRVFPPYMSDGAYILSGNIAEKLLAVSRHMPYLYIEDVFITGILRFAIGDVLTVNSNVIAQWWEKEPDPCKFMSSNKIS